MDLETWYESSVKTRLMNQTFRGDGRFEFNEQNALMLFRPFISVRKKGGAKQT